MTQKHIPRGTISHRQRVHKVTPDNFLEEYSLNRSATKQVVWLNFLLTVNYGCTVKCTPEIILKLLEVYKRLINFILGSECRAHGCSVCWPKFLQPQTLFFRASHTYQYCVFYLNFFQFRLGIGSHQFIQGKHDHGGSAMGRRQSSACWSHQGTRGTKWLLPTQVAKARFMHH